MTIVEEELNFLFNFDCKCKFFDDIYYLICTMCKDGRMTVISQDGRFEWDSEKDATNVKKHCFSFSEILEVYDDPYMLTMYDSVHSSREEDRYFCVGCIRGVVLITTCHTERNGRIRLISALKAEKKLEELYNEWLSKSI